VLEQSTDTARTLVSQLLAHGVRDVVIAPGSRSAPLAIAFAQAEQAGLLCVHVRIDERDAGFLALGLAKASKAMVPILVTSGTAVANLLPAVVEAFQTGIPLVVLSADRPLYARGSSAPQTINQSSIFGSFVKGQYDAQPEDFDSNTISELLSLARTPHRGPVHLNIQFEMPLVPSVQNLDWAPRQPEEILLPTPVNDQVHLDLPAHGVIVAGDIAQLTDSRAVGELAQHLGWPIVAEPSANVHTQTNALAHGVLLVASEQLPTPDCVLSVGTVGLSRPILRLLNASANHIAIHLPDNGPERPDPVQSAARIIEGLPTVASQVDPSWLARWKNADAAASEVIADALSAETLSGLSCATGVWDFAHEDDQLLVAASWSVRHLEAFAENRQGLTVYGNRGANGIDGLISTAWGIAASSPARTYLLIGDVAFLHDVGGLNTTVGTKEPDLTIVVMDNDGGGIFSQLEQGNAEFAAYFEKVFGTPHGKDLWQISESFGFATTRVTTKQELNTTLKLTSSIPGVHILICLTGSRSDENALIKAINHAVKQNLTPSA
jgi:2-succinyl-5-enolpyruvyl-6-hydroxy-3-cyclohexene-1-carboxylate synthase